MKIGVPGEFHEDRWQRTAEDSERLCSRAHGKQAVPIEFKLSRGEGGFRPLFGTATLPTDASGASRRGEGGFWPVFGTTILPTGTSEPSRRAKEGLLTALRHGTPAHRYLSGILAEPL